MIGSLEDNLGISEAVARAEAALLALAGSSKNSRPIFILAAPRTGSTFLYQVAIKAFDLPYISNLTNDCFPRTPIIGLALQRGVKVDVGNQSRYGKTEGLFQPSEGSGPMMNWFGGGHPSQKVSCCALPGKEAHFIATLAACEIMYDGRPLLIKNAWNCFRVAYLAARLPGARFIWVRRDIRKAAESDLEARCKTKGNPHAWNSATPSNVEALRKLPPEHQVVENQFEFNQAIKAGLSEYAQGRWIDVWYEDFIADPASELDRMTGLLGLPRAEGRPVECAIPNTGFKISDREASSISRYIDTHCDRLGVYCYSRKEYK